MLLVSFLLRFTSHVLQPIKIDYTDTDACILASLFRSLPCDAGHIVEFDTPESLMDKKDSVFASVCQPNGDEGLSDVELL
jgi:hypothetical protein